MEIPERGKEILDKRGFAHLATLMPDGSPQVTPVWVDHDGDVVVVNTQAGRLKLRNMRDDPRVALSVQDPDDPYAYVAIRGRVTEITEEGADDHIDALAHRYEGLGPDEHPYRRPGKARLLVRIEPDSVHVFGD